MDYIGKNGLVQEISRFVFEVEVEESQRTLAKTLIERCDDPAEEVKTLPVSTPTMLCYHLFNIAQVITRLYSSGKRGILN